ncbi:uncharacterized protein RCC_07438 [Ramularia collo-cygni]|uniref:Uncharacterized protein n=1 Tax=Ramularia collo-cygni TaxID=112498 RepID=A0A2D3VFC0_9PEZI|nr:uncharacterized protein RCC_07438 [Ramularia collo-cygni]CZT21574.1 uncharacterized protein RCC_07438 [Ramularia collo-cygni]
MDTSTVFVTTSSIAYTVSTATIVFTSTKTTYTPATSLPMRRLRHGPIAHTDDTADITAEINRAAEATLTTTTVNAGLTITSFINVGATHFDQTVSSTITTTLMLPAPTYTYAAAVNAGCQNTPTVDTLQLDPSVTDKNDAVTMCQDHCSQNGQCASLVVQHLFPDYGDVISVYKCFMNGQNFDEGSNLLCGLAENVWGAADAYDAVGRGLPDE